MTKVKQNKKGQSMNLYMYIGIVGSIIGLAVLAFLLWLVYLVVMWLIN